MKARAKTLDGDVVEGSVTELWFEIDPTTLEYRIGTEWYSMEQLVNEVEFKVCEDCAHSECSGTDSPCDMCGIRWEDCFERKTNEK